MKGQKRAANKIKRKFVSLNSWKRTLSIPVFFFLLTMPASTNFKLKDYGFGSGGIANSTSPNYSLEAITGELSGGSESSPSYNIGPGLIFTNQANVPGAPTFDNPSNYYNKLRLIINNGNNPSDTKFAVAISTDNFVTTNYVQSDNTVGAVLGAEDYQTYAAWGGGSDIYVIGLTANTTYKVKAKAMQGKFTETGYGPVATAATISPTLSFGIDTNIVNYGSLTAGSVTDSPTITANFSTNAEIGGKVYIYGQNAGLLSPTKNHTINSISGDLSPSTTEGFGAQGTSVTQTSGGPLSIVAPYNVSSSNVGIVDTTVREIFSSAFPITGGIGTLVLKAKSISLTPAANDYSELLTVIASGNF